MTPAINLVCTRCTDGNHAALQRWYNDHAQLLMACPLLQSAELFQAKAANASLDYFCLYHFDKLSDFAAFDSGDVMAQVRDLSNEALGRSSIEIIKRTQYERVLNRNWVSDHSGWYQAVLLELLGSDLPTTLRWLNDVLYRMHTENALQAAQVYVAQNQEQIEMLVLFQCAEQAFPSDWLDWRSPYAERGKINTLWQAKAQRITQWLR
ncbi:MAG: hypothetical protein ACKO1L_09145 [Brachymonas sp.]